MLEFYQIYYTIKQFLHNFLIKKYYIVAVGLFNYKNYAINYI